jgi:hypothetical protein
MNKKNGQQSKDTINLNVLKKEWRQPIDHPEDKPKK